MSFNVSTPNTIDARTPSEFRYWANIDTLWARALRLTGRAILGFDPAPSDDVVRAFAASYYDADPLAEAFVEEVYLGSGPGGTTRGRALLDQAIDHGIESVPDAPASLRALFADIDRDPPWLDHEMVERGARAFRRYGPDVFQFAGAITLEGYSESSVAKPLVLTGAYAGDSTRRRFLETAAFWIAVSEPGGLARFAPGRASAIRVRIMHVFVRKRLLSHPEWSLEKWGVPISQGDAVLTLMGGSFAPGMAMKAMGYRPSARDIEAMMHFWRYVGHMMGVRPDFYPSTLEDAWRLSFATIVKAAKTSGDDGRHLCKSYVNAFAPDPNPDRPLLERAREKISHRMHIGMTRFFLPPWTYRRQELPSAGLWALHPLVQFPFIFTAETLRRMFPSVLEETFDRRARRRRDRWFAHYMGKRRAEYRPAESFTR